MSASSWQALVHDPVSERHIVQIYRDHSFLREAVSSWVAASFRSGGGALLLCTPEHAAMVRMRLREDGEDPLRLEREGRLVVVDADDLIDRFIGGKTVDADGFHRIVSTTLASARAACGGGDIRVWGELVNVLLARGNSEAAERLEAVWNDIVEEEQVRLLCSYRVDNLAPETHEGSLRRICAGHSQLIPEDDYGRFEVAVSRALVDLFGDDEARTVRGLFEARRSVPIGMPSGQAVLMALHEVQPTLGKRLLRATREHLHSMGGA